MKKILLVLAAAVFAPSVSHAFPGADVDISVGYDFPKPSGHMTLKTDTVTTRTFDAKNDLNLGTGQDFIARLDVNHSIPILPNIYVHHLPVELSGDVGSQHAELKLQQDDVGLYYNLPFLKEATDEILEARLGINARIVNLKAEVRGFGAPPADYSANFSTVIPMGYAEVEIKPLHWLSLSAELKTLPLGSSGLTEISGELKVRPYHPLYLSAGYFNYNVKIDPSLASGAPSADFTVSGPFFFLGVEL